MKYTLYRDIKGIEQKSNYMVIPSNIENGKELKVFSTGVISLSKITDQLVNTTVIIHDEEHHRDAIDIETKLIERTSLKEEEEITYININDLINNFLPQNDLLFTSKLNAYKSNFTFIIKTRAGQENLTFSAELSFNNLRLTNIKKRLTDYTHRISKITHFIENNNDQTHKMGEYVNRLKTLVNQHFNHFSSSHFQSFMSVARHSDVLRFERCRDMIDYEDNDAIKKIKDDIETIQYKVNEKIVFNLKGIKIYFVNKKMSINLLSKTLQPSQHNINIALTHIMMCGQFDDFQTRIERIKLLYS